MTTDKKTQEKPDATKQKAPRQQATKQKTVLKAHEKPIAHKAATNNNNNQTVVVKQNMEKNTQVPKKINVQDLFAVAGVSQTNGKQVQRTKQRTMSNNMPAQQQSAPPMHKTRSYTYGTSVQTPMNYNMTPAKTRGASPPSGAFANPAYADSPSARELPMPPLNWLFSETKPSTPTTTLSGADFMRAFAVASVN